MSLTSTVTQRGFYPSPHWTESSDGAMVGGSNQPLVESEEELYLRAMFQGSQNYRLKPVKDSVVTIFLNITSFHSIALDESP